MKQGHILSEKEGRMVVKNLELMQKRLEKLKGKFLSNPENKSTVSNNKSRRGTSRKSSPAA